MRKHDRSSLDSYTWISLYQYLWYNTLYQSMWHNYHNWHNQQDLWSFMGLIINELLVAWKKNGQYLTHIGEAMISKTGTRSTRNRDCNQWKPWFSLGKKRMPWKVTRFQWREWMDVGCLGKVTLIYNRYYIYIYIYIHWWSFRIIPGKKKLTQCPPQIVIHRWAVELDSVCGVAVLFWWQSITICEQPP